MRVEQVKIFTFVTGDKEEEINDFLSEIDGEDIIDIQFNTASSMNGNYNTMMIRYEVEVEDE